MKLRRGARAFSITQKNFQRAKQEIWKSSRAQRENRRRGPFMQFKIADPRMDLIESLSQEQKPSTFSKKHDQRGVAMMKHRATRG